MKIIILGAGQVGTTVAQTLVGEANEITMVDHNAALLKSLQERLDISTVRGHAAHPGVLQQAGIEDADLVLAVTDSDETNMIACQVARTLFHTPMRIARVRSQDYLDHPKLFGNDAVPVDVLINPEQLVTDFIRRLIEQPGALQILDFMEGKAQLVAFETRSGDHVVGRSLKTLMEQTGNIKFRIAALFRNDSAIIPDEDTLIDEGDELFFLASRHDTRPIMEALHGKDTPNRKVFIIGGGNIGKQLALQIESRFRVKIIEQDRERCRHLAEELSRSIVIAGDGGDGSLLQSEEIANADMYCAVTDDDEVNILSSMLAGHLGVRRTLSIINRPGYVDLAQDVAVDIAVSPAQVTIGALLTHIRMADVQVVYSLRKGAAEAMEFIAHGDRDSSRVVGRRIDELPLPAGTTIMAIGREGKLIFPDASTRLATNDRVALLVTNRKKVSVVEKLFQVGVDYV